MTLQCVDKMLLKYIFLETGVHPVQNGLYIALIVPGVHVQGMREMNGCLDTGSNFKQH